MNYILESPLCGHFVSLIDSSTPWAYGNMTLRRGRSSVQITFLFAKAQKFSERRVMTGPFPPESMRRHTRFNHGSVDKHINSKGLHAFRDANRSQNGGRRIGTAPVSTIPVNFLAQGMDTPCTTSTRDIPESHRSHEISLPPVLGQTLRTQSELHLLLMNGTDSP